MRLLTVLLSLFSLAAQTQTQAQPNIIIVMPDDMGYGDIGATGNPVIRTPNLDLLSKESAEMTNFYVSPVCSPTRACLMTGRYNYRTRCIDTFKGRSMMDPEEVTVAESLKKAGYTTGIFGKWHLGDNYPLRPQDQGFDEVLIHRGGGLAQPSEPIENAKRYTDPILFHNGEQVQTKGYCTDVYFDAAIEFMESAKKEGKPFFAYIPPNAPHGPYHDVPEKELAYYQSIDLSPVLGKGNNAKHQDTVARVFAMVENIDQNMGKLNRYLKESGQFYNTLVLFFTDNGPNSMRYVGPFQGMKTRVHEGGIRTMFYARWPEQLKAGLKNDRIAAHIDVAPTLLDIAGVPSENQDGRSLLPLLKGEKSNWPDRRLFLQSHRGNQPVEFHHFAVREQDWKLLRGSGFGLENPKGDDPFELYHISEDPGESKNLAEENPQKVAELKAAYSEWLKDVSSTRKNNYAPPRIIIGDPAELESDLSIQDWRVSADSPGWGGKGKWMVTFANSGPYQVAISWEEAIGAREIVLEIGDERIKGQLEEGSTKLVFPVVKAPTGDTSISVDIGDKKSIPRFVTFTKK